LRPFLDVQTYGFDGTNQTSSTFSPDNSTFFNLTSPTLNISAFYFYGGYIHGGYSVLSPDWIIPYRSGGPDLQNASLARFARIDQPDNRTYDIPYIKANGLCQQQNTYQWGFSFLLLFIALLLSALWALGMWATWLDAYYNSRIDAAHERDMGSWRAAMDLAGGISASLGAGVLGDPDTTGDVLAKTTHLGNAEMRRRVRRASGRGRMSYMSLDESDRAMVTRSAQLRSWLEMRAWGRWLLRWWAWVIAGVTLAFLLLGVVWPLVTIYGP
jgi:hypothetical protein